MAGIEIHRTREEAVAQPTGGCACGEHDDDMPELDVQTIPHAIRHAAIFGALNALRPGSGMILSATHDPVPLLTQLADRYAGEFATEYLDRGPQRWRILVRRVAAS